MIRDFLVRGLRYVAKEINTVGLEQRLQNSAWQEAVAFIEANDHRGCDFHTSATSIRSAAFRQAPKTGLLLEFGVNRGKSIQLFSKLLIEGSDSREIIGFDNFTGLTEDWTGMGRENGHAIRKKYFDLGGRPPTLNDNIKLAIGDIEDTLIPFLDKNSGNQISFIHIDTDTYRPCQLILENCKPFLQNGSIILFDQLLGYPGCRFHEFAALHEIFDKTEYEFIGFGVAQERSNLVKAAIRYRNEVGPE